MQRKSRPEQLSLGNRKAMELKLIKQDETLKEIKELWSASKWRMAAAIDARSRNATTVHKGRQAAARHMAGAGVVRSRDAARLHRALRIDARRMAAAGVVRSRGATRAH